MSNIINKGRFVEWLGGYSGFGLLVLIFLVMYSDVVCFVTSTTTAHLDLFNSGALVCFLALLSAAIAIRPLAFFKDAARFNNVRDALISGCVVIVTNKDDTLREVADEISDYLKQLGVNHFKSGEYTKHLVVENENCFYRASVDDLGPRKPEKCKLTLVLSAKAAGDDGVVSIEYCLLDNGGHSVIFLDPQGAEWPIVDYYSYKTTSRVAKEIVSGIFEELNLVIRAGTVPAN